VARQKQTAKPGQDQALANIRNEGGRLARAYRINPRRTRAALERIVNCFAPELMADPVVLEFAFERFPFSLLAEALNCLPPETAFGLIEDEDLRILAKRVSVAEYLAAPDVPFYTLSELAEQTDLFIDFLEQQRPQLLKSGRPSVGFSACPFLDHSLANLYCDAGVVLTRAGQKQTMAAGELKEIQELRSKMLNLKIHVLRQLSEVRRETASSLWEKCLRFLTTELLADEAEQFLRVDSIYRRLPDEQTDPADAGSAVSPGGLTNLLEIIGHFEKEGAIGTFADVHELLGEPMARILRDDTAEGCKFPYFKLFGQQDHARLNAALDKLPGLDEKEKAFWQDFGQRINDALDQEFCSEVITRTKVKRKHIPQFEPAVRTYAEWAKYQLAVSPVLPLVTTASAPTVGDGQLHVFRKQGSTWTIRYKDETTLLPDSRGAFYICYLLERPGQDILPSEMRAAIVNAAVSEQSPRRRASTEGKKLSRPASLGTILDAKGKADLQQRLLDIDEEIELDTKAGRGTSKLEAERETIKAEMRRAAGIGYRPKEMSVQQKKDRDAVCNAVERTMQKLEANAPAFARHLQNSLRLSTICSYIPEPFISWNA
jgi:hypothetical protein